MSADITPDELASLRQSVETAGPDWYYYAQTMRLIQAVDSARSQLAALQSVPQGVVVPELTAEDMEQVTGREYFNGFRTGYHLAKSRARLVPTPPQAAPGAVVIRDPDDDDWDAFGFQQGTKAEILRVWTRALATCKESLQAPQADAVVVPEFDREKPYEHPMFSSLEDLYLEGIEHGIWLGQVTHCLPRPAPKPVPEYVATCIGAFRTSAQDHNGEGAK